MNLKVIESRTMQTKLNPIKKQFLDARSQNWNEETLKDSKT